MFKKKTSAISHMLNDEHGEWDHPELVRLAFETIDQYGAVLEETSTSNLALGYCEKRLPFPKSEIQVAIEFILKVLNNKESWPKLKKEYPEIAKQIFTDQYYNAIEVGYITLASFVPDKEGELCEKASKLLVEGKVKEVTTSSWYKKYNKVQQRIYKEESSMLEKLYQKFGRRGFVEKHKVSFHQEKGFASNLLDTANCLARFSKIVDMQEATSVVLVHILTSVLGKAEHSGCYWLTTEGHEKEEHVEKVVVAGTKFLCFMGTSLCLCLKDEGVELPINDVIAVAGTATFMLPNMQTCLIERNAGLLHEGMEHYKEIWNERKGNKDDTLKYANDIMQIMDLYIRGQVWKDQTNNEKIIDLLVSLYMQSFNTYE